MNGEALPGDGPDGVGVVADHVADLNLVNQTQKIISCLGQKRPKLRDWVTSLRLIACLLPQVQDPIF